MSDVAILLTEMRKEAEKIEDTTLLLIRRAINILFTAVDYVNPEGLKKYQLKDNIEAKELALGAFNDYVHEVSDHKKARTSIMELLLERQNHHEKGGLLRMLDFLVKVRELRDYCGAFAKTPSYLDSKKLDNLRRRVAYIVMHTKPPIYSTQFWRKYQPITMGELEKNIDINPLIALLDALGSDKYEKGTTKIIKRN